MRMSDGLAQKPYVVRVDRQGFIMPSKVHDHPDLTIAFLGGSTTECIYVDEATRFPYLAGRLHGKQTGLKVNSYNAGRSGNNTLHCLNILLNKVVNLKPDIVVLMENINDLAILIYEKTYWNTNPSRSPIQERLPTFKTVGHDLRQTFYLVRDLTIPNLSRELKKIFAFAGQGQGGRVSRRPGPENHHRPGLAGPGIFPEPANLHQSVPGPGDHPGAHDPGQPVDGQPRPLDQKDDAGTWKPARGLPMRNSRAPLTGSIKPSGR